MRTHQNNKTTLKNLTTKKVSYLQLLEDYKQRMLVLYKDNSVGNNQVDSSYPSIIVFIYYTGVFFTAALSNTFRKKDKRYDQLLKLNNNIKKQRKQESKQLRIKESIKHQKNYMPKETEQYILRKLKTFEKNKQYLNKQISLNYVAAEFGINHRYLSHVINKHEQKDFANYINELRIHYIIDCLDNKPEYLKYKISYLADKCGFTSHSRFTLTFKKIIGESPSSYINDKMNQI